MQPRRDVIFLCTRLADYMYQCICYLARTTEYNVTVVRYRPDQNATYNFSGAKNVSLIFYDEIELSVNWAKELNPAIIYVSGWVDPKYKKIARAFRDTIPVVIGMDNPWKGNWKQYVHTYISFLTVKPYFNKIWVAGPQQFVYAQRLGFAFDDILQGVYSADDEKYQQDTISAEGKNEPTILFVGRLLEYKRPHLLATIFTELQKEYPSLSKWKLRIAGKGPLEEEIRSLNNPNILIEGFLDPSRLPSIFNEASIFCLPSKGEHWGVVVHEAVLSGLPILLSDTVSAGSSLLIHGYNGRGFKTNDRNSLKNALHAMMSSSDEELREMGDRSSLLAKQFSKQIWTQRLLSVVN